MEETKSSGISSSQLQLIAQMLGFKPSISISMTDSIESHQRDIQTDIEKTHTQLNDEYGNSLTSTGSDDKVKSFTTYGYDNNTLNFTLWTVLYNDSWVFKRAIDKPSTDMINSWFTLTNEDDKKLKVYKTVKKCKQDLIQFVQWGKLYGGSVAIVMFDNFEDADYSKSINIDKLRKSKAVSLYVTDRWYGCSPSDSTVDDMCSLDFGKPTFYNITFADGKELKVKHDYILRFENRSAPNFIKRGQLQGWGYAEGAHIINEISRDDQLKASITSLINKSLIEVIKMSGMRGVFMGADQDNENQLTKRLEMVNWARTYNSLTFLDKDDEYQEHSFSGLGGLADLLNTNMWLIAAALEMQGVLFGDLKNGMGADSGALERYDEVIHNACESLYRKPLTKFLSILYKKFDIDEEVDFEFDSLLKEKKNDKEMEDISKYIDVLEKLSNSSIITAKMYAQSLKTYQKKKIIDFGLTNEYIDTLDDNIAEEMENIDLDNDNDDLENQNIDIKGVK